MDNGKFISRDGGKTWTPIITQPWYISHAETIAQNVIGQLLATLILWIYNIPFNGQGWKIQLTFLVVAYLRGYAIRRLFNRWIK